MWNLIIRVGALLSTVLIGKQLLDQVWPKEIRPARLYRPEQIARYLRTDTEQVIELIKEGTISARWVGGRPVILGASVLDFLSRTA